MRLRLKSFETMVDQDIGYFDDPANPVGALCNKLANDASHVQSGMHFQIVYRGDR